MFLRSAADFDAATAKLSAAIALLHEKAPRALGNIRNFTPRVFGFAIAGIGEYLPAPRLCLVDDDLLLSDDLTPERLACTLIHEATHARLMRAGIPYSSQNRIRVERLCTRAEIGVAKLFPSWKDLQPELQRRMANAEELWSTAQHRAATSQRLRTLDAPRWIIRALERRARGPANGEL